MENKQIEEMAKLIHDAENNRCYHKSCRECEYADSDDALCTEKITAKYLMEEHGYRKASEAIEEAFEQIRKKAFPHYYGGIPVITRADIDGIEEELKKKYTEEKKDV